MLEWNRITIKQVKISEELDKNDNKQHKVKTISNNKIYANKLYNDYLLSVYYSIFIE